MAGTATENGLVLIASAVGEVYLKALRRSDLMVNLLTALIRSAADLRRFIPLDGSLADETMARYNVVLQQMAKRSDQYEGIVTCCTLLLAAAMVRQVQPASAETTLESLQRQLSRWHIEPTGRGRYKATFLEADDFPQVICQGSDLGTWLNALYAHQRLWDEMHQKESA